MNWIGLVAARYGKYHGDKRPDGGTGPGDLTDRFKGSSGVDADDNSDGVR